MDPHGHRARERSRASEKKVRKRTEFLAFLEKIAMVLHGVHNEVDLLKEVAGFLGGIDRVEFENMCSRFRANNSGLIRSVPWIPLPSTTRSYASGGPPITRGSVRIS